MFIRRLLDFYYTFLLRDEFSESLIKMSNKSLIKRFNKSFIKIIFYKTIY